jgi:hypothetical protein
MINTMKAPVCNSLLILMALIAGPSTFSQSLDSTTNELIAIAGRPSEDSICLRWAPLNYSVWQLGNRNGYKIERYVIARNGQLLRNPERRTLNRSIRPLPQEAWEPIVKTNKYAAIAAQALFGDRFEVDLSQSDMFTIVNKVRENEQRFSFALFSADLSPAVAKASGLWITDAQISSGEKYLYRITINATDSLRSSIFISPDDDYLLPSPKNLTAEFRDRFVSLRWDKYKTNHYTAHIIERSEDGTNFVRISETPIVTVSPTAAEDTRHDYAIDSIANMTKTFYYRVKGVTAFGEESNSSDVVSGTAMPTVIDVPYITSVESIENKFLQIHWTFPDGNNNAIKHFTLERSTESKGNFSPITPDKISPESRVYQDNAPKQINYYRLIAEGLNGDRYPSHVYFAQLVDSIPPSKPILATANIDENGVVKLSWIKNKDLDIFGYRIYKSFHRSEEPAQITAEPVESSSFTDHVNLNTLNETVYYRVMAIDQNQNHSELSEPIKVALPDLVRPQAPVLLPVKSTSSGVLLNWIRSSSHDVVRYEVYRKNTGHKQWEQIAIKEIGTDTVFSHLDTGHEIGSGDHHYTVVAIDERGLESDPAHPVTGTRINSSLQPSIRWGRHNIVRDENKVTLRWINSKKDIEAFRIYKSVDSSQLLLYKTLGGDQEKMTDTFIPGHLYKYHIMAIFKDGNKSLMSEEARFEY